MPRHMTARRETAALRAAQTNPQAMLDRYANVRDMSLELARPLSPEDCVVQSMTEASPTKWHLAHTTWFFETFILTGHADRYQPFHERYSFLFNSYYNQVGDRIARPTRAMMTRPTMTEVLDYREFVDGAMTHLLEHIDSNSFASIVPLLELGLQHEQQHQELLLTDVKHLLSLNPLQPAYLDNGDVEPAADVQVQWKSFEAGVYEVGYAAKDFCFDNELPQHRVFLEAFSIANRTVTNGEYITFINEKGYERPELWLDLGWSIVNEQQWAHPLYWRRESDGSWSEFTLRGRRPVDEKAPLTAISLFEADAYARWNGCRLPSEQEWEVAAADVEVEGNFSDTRQLHPVGCEMNEGLGDGLLQMFGNNWEWTGSQYRPYPGYDPPTGAIGEYNGKFMCNQFVLRGGSCATPASHIRRTYRNFFPPESRWQFAGVRLVKDY